MKSKATVVVIGAGPCGLTAAVELLRLGVQVRLLEASTERMTGTRALQLWPPALEIYRGVGIRAEAERLGVTVRTNVYNMAGGKVLRVALGAENEPLLLPQEHTVRLLEEALEAAGGKVERGVRFEDLAAGEDSVTVQVTGASGTELIEADWVIGADGVRSDVRERLGIDFPGRRVPTNLILAEGRVDGDFEEGAVHYFLGRGGSLVFAPMSGGRVRVSAPVPPDLPIDRTGVQRLLDERGPGDLRIVSLDHIGTFSSSERIASSLRRGRVFLVGDAAHTHSPLGGQGLNLGLQDVHNLTWKLAGVVHGRLGAQVLAGYEVERRQAAEQIVGMTGRMMRMFMLGPAAAKVRNAVWGGLERTGALRRWFVPLLAGWGVRYTDELLRVGAKRGRAKPGTRTPHWVPARDTVGRLRLLTTGDASALLVAEARALAERNRALVTHDHFAGRAEGFLVLRPDGYVAASGASAADLAEVEVRIRALAAVEEKERSADGR
ncbi:FAD-dependent monooxygenase [Saccharothrix sp. NRRL B-16348]|uniref:FAD-dependent monooxygenase n=1 Tax=Saccharothrix sp. NRRL B-16348 TaxID=1415542 RepID=UPI0006B066E6|nr:FAD-dependent monooxygenase [Saccharothrix sp. NRRL B-16348]